MDNVAKDVSVSLPKETLTGLLIDESGWVKKGTEASASATNTAGTLAKPSFAGCGFRMTVQRQIRLAGRRPAMLSGIVDFGRGKVPWSGHPGKRTGLQDQAGPRRGYHQTPALDGHCLRLLGADGLYWNDAALAREIDGMGLVYMLDIHSNQQIYLEEPELRIPERKTANGPVPKKLKASYVPIAVCKYIGALEASQWKNIDIRHSDKGVLKGQFHFKTVYIWDKTQTRLRAGYWWSQTKKRERGRDQILLFHCTVGSIYRTGRCLHAGSTVLYRHSYKEQIQILGMGPVPDKKVAVLAPPNRP